MFWTYATRHWPRPADDSIALTGSSATLGSAGGVPGSPSTATGLQPAWSWSTANSSTTTPSPISTSLIVSGVHRGVQRALYDARRDELIPEHGIRLVAITPADLDATPRRRLRRNSDHDLPAILELLKSPTS